MNRQLMPAVVMLAMVLMSCSAVAEQARTNELSPHDVYTRQLEGTAIVVDVRTISEYEASHVDGAVNVPLDEVSARLAELQELAADRDLILYCRSGRRAGIAESILREHGVENIWQLGGQMAGWAAEGLPVAQGG